jgi:two-component system sensor histidine kinase DesK
MSPRLRQLPLIHPHSIAARSGNSARWFPILNLIWLYWMVAAPWFLGRTTAWVLSITFLSLPLFLLLWLRAWYGDRRRIVWNTVAIAVLGLAIVPVNSSWSYVIYASVLIPYCTTPRRSMLWLALLLGSFYLIATRNDYSPMLALSAMSMCAALAVINLFGRISRERDAELRLSHDEVRRLAATAERERIGRDLHDLLGHTLSLIAIKGELARRLFDRDPPAARHEVAEIERIAREALAQVRSAVTGIRAAGLAAELASAKLLLESSGIALVYSSEDISLSPATESALALCLREAVTNVQRHARATRVEIELAGEGRNVLLRVRDDGRGGAVARGNGLLGIDERLRALGGSLLIDSPSGRGTLLKLQLPRVSLAAAGSPGADDSV